MGAFLNSDNKFFAFLSNVTNLIILNLIWIVFCIPVVTIVPATAAMYYTTMKMVKKEDPYIVRSFLRSFRQNFRQGIILSAILVAVVGLLYVDMQVLQSFPSKFHLVLLIVFYALCALTAVVAAYVCPLLSQFNNTIIATMKNSVIIGLSHPVKTIVVLGFDSIPIIIFLYWPNYFISTLLFWVLLGFSVIAFVNSVIFSKIFEKYETVKTET